MIGLHGNFGQANYAAAKAGIDRLHEVRRSRVARKGVTVNAIAPGFIETEIIDGHARGGPRSDPGEIPMARFGRPEEVAQAVDSLSKGDYITGQVIEIDGGLYT